MAGWNQPAPHRESKPNNSRSHFLYVTLGVLIAVIAILAILIYKFDTSERASNIQSGDKAITPIKDFEPAKTHHVKEDSPAAQTEESPKRELTPLEQIEELQRKVANGETNITLIVAGTPVVSNATEQLLATVFTTRLGDMPPMMPVVSVKNEEELIKIIDLAYEIKNDDSAEIADIKDTVNAAKKELDKYLREGGSVNEFLTYYTGLLESAHQEYLMCQQEAMRTCRDDDAEFARDYIQKLNDRLKEKGIKEIRLFPHQRKFLGLE